MDNSNTERKSNNNSFDTYEIKNEYTDSLNTSGLYHDFENNNSFCIYDSISESKDNENENINNNLK